MDRYGIKKVDFSKEADIFRTIVPLQFFKTGNNRGESGGAGASIDLSTICHKSSQNDKRS
jgi:hypothetical protein